MVHPLDGARLKIVRAQEHLDSIKSEIGAYLKTRPYRVAAKIDRNDRLRMPVEITVQPPTHIAMVIGDCVTNIRAALDYVAWELAVRYFNPRLDVASLEERRIASLPLYQVAGDNGYTNRLKSLAKRGMPASAISEIDAIQPYNGGYESLWVLHELVNTDKHRLPIITLGFIPAFAYFGTIDKTSGPGTFDPAIDYDVWIDPPAHHPVCSDPNFKTTWTVAEREEMNMYYDVTIHVTFEDVTMP